MALIKQNRIIKDDWRQLELAEEIPEGEPVLVCLEDWQARRDELLAGGGRLGVRLAGGQGADLLAGDLAWLDLVAVDFANFGDGRGFSTARLLREQYGFGGEIRAVGQVIRDQVQFLTRCGFDAFEISGHAARSPWPEVAAEISVHYQPATDSRATALELRHLASAAE